MISILSKTYYHGIPLGDAHDSIGILKNAIVNIYNSTKGEGDEVNKKSIGTNNCLYIKGSDYINIKNTLT